MTEAKSAQPLCPQCGNERDAPREDSIERMLACGDPFHSQSAQPQLPPRPRLIEDGNGNKTHYVANEADAHMNALEAENESLKAQLQIAACECSHDEACALFIRAKKAEAELAAMTEDRNLWQEAHDEDCPNKAMIETLEAERDQALEVIREYRKIHPGCCIRIAGLVNETKLDGRCPTCIKAVELLSRVTKET